MFIPSYKKPGGGGANIPLWSTGTDEEIVAALEAHYNGEIDLTQYWSVGDERTVSLSAMNATYVGESHAAQDVVFVLSNIGGKTLSDGTTECVFQVDQKLILGETGYMNSTDTTAGGWRDCARRTWCNSIYYNAIPSTLKSIFKEFINISGRGNATQNTYTTTDYFALRAEVEVFGTNPNSVTGEGTQVEWYKTSNNRVKTNPNLSETRWFERSNRGSGQFCCCLNNTAYYTYPSQFIGIAPFGVI